MAKQQSTGKRGVPAGKDKDLSSGEGGTGKGTPFPGGFKFPAPPKNLGNPQKGDITTDALRVFTALSTDPKSFWKSVEALSDPTNEADTDLMMMSLYDPASLRKELQSLQVSPKDIERLLRAFKSLSDVDL